ncbi:hypothetical protein FOZ63_022758 [Perkinsus olseni]|uniref:Uncharacterized protein n=2 Tax=Perkinsus olseni TaxID=32597 RepID=A0A7J6U523_PEROL|nr:hypothetical protein FOZ63_022758 [Perkinsus olseni]
MAAGTTTLERGMLRGELPSMLLVDASALQKEIRELGDSTSSERQLWVERDRRLLERLEEIGTGLEHRVSNECAAFDQQTAGLEREVEVLKKPGSPGGPDCRLTEEEQFISGMDREALRATPLPDVLITEQLKALVPGGDEMDDTAVGPNACLGSP